MIWILIGIGFLIYVVLLFMSFTYSCGGYEFKECGFCWVGFVQKPLDFVDWLIDKVRRKTL